MAADETVPPPRSHTTDNTPDGGPHHDAAGGDHHGSARATAPSPFRRSTAGGPDSTHAAAEVRDAGRNGWRTLGVLVIVFAVLSGGGVAWAQLSQQQARDERTYRRGALATIEVDSGAATVSIRAGRADQVVVDQRVGWSLRRPSVSQRLENDTLKISVRCPAPTEVIGCAVMLDIEVPADMAVHATNGSGRTEIQRLTGDIEARTGSGQLDLQGLSGTIWAKAGSGQIIGSELTAERTTVFSNSGSLTLGYARAPRSVTARLASGPLIIHLPDDRTTYRVDLTTAGGRRDVDSSVPGADSADVLDITAASGTVTIDRGGEDGG
ncbi:hypothetical protein GCM10010440_23810 [Kitasatospora cinereorecta]